MLLRVLSAVFCLLFVCGSCTDPASSPISASLTYEYSDYSCDAQPAKAVLSVAAHQGGVGQPRLSLTSVMDVSGSMDGKRLDLLKKANKYLVDKLAEAEVLHKFGSVSFSNAAQTVTPLTELTPQKVLEARSGIEGLTVIGGTNIFAGIEEGMNQQTSDSDEGFVRAVFLFTDGAGGEATEEMKIAVQDLIDASNHDVLIYSFGISSEIVVPTLNVIADVGGGVMYGIFTDVDLPVSIGSALGGLLTEVALKWTYTISVIGNTRITNVMTAWTKTEDTDQQVVVYVGDLAQEEQRDIVIEVALDADCNSQGGLIVIGSYLDAVSFNQVDLTISDVEVKRYPLTPTARDDTALVHSLSARYNAGVKLKDAATSLNADKVDVCSHILDELVADLASEGGSKDSLLGPIIHDVKAFNEKLKTKDSASAENKTTLLGIYDAVAKQRTGLTDAKTYKSIAALTTTARSDLSKDAALAVQQTVISEFELDVVYAVGPVKYGAQFDEVEIVLTIQAPNLADVQVPLSLTTVVSKSTTIPGSVFQGLIETHRHIIDWLLGMKTQEISLGVLAFSGTLDRLQTLAKLSAIDGAALATKLDGIAAEDGTNLVDALLDGVREQIDNQACPGSHAVFVFTDGELDAGEDTIADQLTAVLQSATNGVSVYVFGLGNANVEILKKITDAGYGGLYFANNEQDVALSFGDAAAALLSAVGRNVQIAFKTADDAVEIAEVSPVATIEDKNSTTVAFHDLFQGEKRDVRLKLHLPKGTALGDLLEAKVSYTDALTCDPLENDPIVIDYRKADSSFGRRSLELHVIALLEEAAKYSATQGDISLAIEQITAAIEAVADSFYPDKTHQANLQADLIKVRRALTAAKQDSTRRKQAFLAVDCLHDLLMTQRSTSVSAATSFLTSGFYGGGLRATNRESLAASVTGIPARPKEDVFRVTYNNPPAEITTDKQDVTVELDLDSIDQADHFRSSHIVFVLDATTTVDVHGLDVMKAFILRTRTEYRSLKATDVTFHFSIMTFGSTAGTVLSPTLVTDLTEQQIENIFATLVQADTKGFLSAVEDGMDALKGLADTDLIMIPFIGHSLVTQDTTAIATKFSQLVTLLDYPITFTPIMVNPDLSTTYFECFPPWVQSRITAVHCNNCTDEAFDLLRPLFISVAAKRVIVNIQPTRDATIIGIEGAQVTADGKYFVSDVIYGKKKTIKVKLSVTQYDHNEMLFTSSFDHFDMRTLRPWTKTTDPLVFTRVQASILQDRVAVRKSTTAYLNDVKTLIAAGYFDAAMSHAARATAAIVKTGSSDRTVIDILDSMDSLVEQIHALTTGKTTSDAVVADIDSTLADLDVNSVIAAPQVTTGAEQTGGTGGDVDVSPAPPCKPVVPELGLKMSLDDVLVISKATFTVEVPIVIETPLSTGELVDAHVTIMIDSSVNADKDVVAGMTEALLNSLAGRQGKRSIKILSWNDAVASIFEDEDFQKDAVAEAVQNVKAVQLTGDLHYTLALEEAESLAQDSDAKISVLFCIVASGDAMTESPGTLIGDADAALADPAAMTPIFSITSGVGQSTLDFLTEFSPVTGGESFKLDLTTQEASDEEIAHRAENVARTLVMWIETVHSKRIVIDIQTKPLAVFAGATADVQNVIVDEATGKVIVLSMPFGAKVTIKVTLNLGSGGSYASSAGRFFQRQLLNSGGATTLMDVQCVSYDMRQHQAETTAPASFGVEAVDQHVIDAIEKLKTEQDKAMSRAMMELGKNDVGGAVLSMGQLEVLAGHSGIEGRLEATTIVDAVSKIGTQLQEYSEKREDDSLVQSVISKIADLNPEKGYLTDDEAGLKLTHNLVTARKEDTEVQSTITIEFPESNSQSSQGRSLTVAAVFDAVEFSTLIDNERTPFEVQKWLVDDLVRLFVKFEGYSITLTAVGYNDAGSSSAATIHFDPNPKTDISAELATFFASISIGNSPAGMDSGLELGLSALEESTETSNRMLMLFVSSFSNCLAPGNSYENLLRPYITHPINPVTVMTYVVGPADPPLFDPISTLTGGMRYRVPDTSYVEAIAKHTIEELKKHAFRDVRLHISGPDCVKNSVEVLSAQPMLKYSNLAVLVGNMKPGESQSVQLKVALDEWDVADADLFEYAVSYFDTERGRWFMTPFNALRLRRTSTEAFDEIVLLKEAALAAVEAAIVNLKAKEVKAAAEALRGALEKLDASMYQDDSYVIALLELLSDVYEDCLNLLHTKSSDVQPVLIKMTDCATKLGLNGDSASMMVVRNSGMGNLLKGALVFSTFCVVLGVVYFVVKV